MKVSDDMVDAALNELFSCLRRQKVHYISKVSMRCAIESAMKVYAMERLIEAGAEQMEKENMR